MEVVPANTRKTKANKNMEQQNQSILARDFCNLLYLLGCHYLKLKEWIFLILTKMFFLNKIFDLIQFSSRILSLKTYIQYPTCPKRNLMRFII